MKMKREFQGAIVCLLIAFATIYVLADGWAPGGFIAQNTVLAGSDGAGNAKPSGRALVNNDLPIVSAAKGGTGVNNGTNTLTVPFDGYALIGRSVRRSTTQTVTDSTTFTTDDTLSLPVVTGHKYKFYLYYNYNSINTSGIKVNLTGGSATFSSGSGIGLIWTDTTAGSALAAGNMFPTSSSVAFTATGLGGKVQVECTAVCSGSGTVIPQFAQNAETGAAESVIVNSNSDFYFIELP